MKRTGIFAVILAASVLLAGCSGGEGPSPSQEVPSPSAPVVSETPAPSVPIPEELEFYSLIFGDKAYTVDLTFSPEGLFENGEAIENPAEGPYPASRYYSGDSLIAQTFLEEDGSEKLVFLTTWKDGTTAAGIGIGSTLEELKSAYPGQLFFLNGVYDTGFGGSVAYNRMYTCYQPEDGTNCSYHFYLKDKVVVMMEALDGLDAPRTWYADEPAFGEEHLHWEYLSDGPGTRIHYFFDYEDGSEETLLDIYGTTEHHDLDGDGLAEILVYLPESNSRGIGIYDMVDGELVYVDVNQTLGCEWSSYMGNIGNLQNDAYRNCMNVGMEAGGSSEVYSYADGVLTYECTFAEAMSPAEENG